MSQHHDPVHPDSDHLTAELIADLEEGLLDAESAAHARHHLEGCDACRDLQSQVLGVTSALSQLPELTMPADVESRLMASLPAPASKTIVPIGSAPSRRTGGGLGRILGVAACAAGVMLVGALVVSINDQSPAPSPLADNAVATTASEDFQLANYSATVSGTTYTHDSLDRQATKLMDDVVPATPSAMVSSTPTATVSPTSSPTTTGVSATSTPTGSSLDTKSLPPQVARVATVPLVTDPVAAQECIKNYLQGTLAPLAIDLGLFNGHPAVIVVLPLENYANRAEVWVLDPQCKDTIDYAQFALPEG